MGGVEGEGVPMNDKDGESWKWDRSVGMQKKRVIFFLNVINSTINNSHLISEAGAFINE